ncbi:two component transcriptional regulator, LuxR family [Paenibacillus tianmuensis]|uniref:Two component transcriptional regulator, LuxR family n=1 Tax=Paenibacillus tianmuensis TaxID=624147 RepID=A0A1G4TC42_9BACL|nr:response regulator transcription factor [Paenibacillus tianmuensis]SCW78777.1 two component transcriptional regulator, LuxR family [Paenibacillus tianmuensis]
MNETVKALVIDDHPLVARATKELLEEADCIEVVGMASSAEEGMEQIRKHQPGLVFLDYQLPDLSGTEVAAQIKQEYPHIHIVIFTGHDLTEAMNRLIELKVSGVLSKESSIRTIKNMVNCILDNHTMLPLSLYHQIQLSGSPSYEELNDEEVMMMGMVVKGATHDQIADHIHMSKRTVDNYLRRIYDKLGAKSRMEAMEKFIKSRHYT